MPQRHAIVAMTFERIDYDTLRVHTYEQFTDGSGRQNYHSSEMFKRVRGIRR